MQEKTLFQIKLKSYIGLCVSVALPLGFTFGALTLIIALFGGTVYSDAIFIRLTGIPAGIANLIVAPLAFSFVALIGGLFSYLPFKFFLKIKKGIVINGEWGEEEKINNQASQENTTTPSTNTSQE